MKDRSDFRYVRFTIREVNEIQICRNHWKKRVKKRSDLEDNAQFEMFNKGLLTSGHFERKSSKYIAKVQFASVKIEMRLQNWKFVLAMCERVRELRYHMSRTIDSAIAKMKDVI